VSPYRLECRVEALTYDIALTSSSVVTRSRILQKIR
jgi:hypothetical protein